MNQTCSTCRHFHPTGLDLGVGECWRYPPTAVPIQTPAGVAAASVKTPVGRKDSCGEWTSQPLEVTEETTR